MTPTRAPRWFPLLLALALWAVPGAAQAPTPPGEASLRARMDAFLNLYALEHEDTAAAFFPRSGDFTWVETTHLADGEVVGIWRFPAADFRAAFRGPLMEEDVLVVDYHGHRVGAFSHQVRIRRPRWRRAPGNRFVPADAPDSSPIFVQWRREDGRWVVSVIGDESYTGDAPLPAWCC
ncbi:MAG TPA: hypothetical protein VEQ60_15990 [Longimicrobium sp.]|nr:hypothetical protein [Longimicrobium sp.]